MKWRPFPVVVALVALAMASACTGAARHTAAAPSSSTSPPTTNGVRLPVLRCAPRAAQTVPSGQVPGSASAFVPGHAETLLACRYHGFNQRAPAGSLAATARFVPAPIAAALNAAPHVGSRAVFDCPFDGAELIVVHFGYSNGAVLTAVVSTQGCRFASNGDVRIRTPDAVITAFQARLGRDVL